MSDNNKIYGYVRVSSTDQNEERQMVGKRLNIGRFDNR